ncbi:MAG: imidazoleglycerol-phosphate dehydratase HisB [Candidatus Poribacteria bacterium]|nr:imidazoleglycerol-phosphate dehydratase HisB [Candidatus Poribacteria bacterium]
MARRGQVSRKTGETQIELELNLDGTGKSDIRTGVGFLDHMLDLVAKHGFLDLSVRAEGDLQVDFHHTTEDVGICLGMAIAQAIGDKAGMRRFGGETIPMYEALATVNIDLCGRPFLVWNTPLDGGKVGDFDAELAEEFFHGVVNHSGATMHVNVPYGANRHHLIEAVFKAFARALDQATSLDPRVQGVLSSKGSL